MNASQMTYGVEFEVMLPASVQIAVGGYHRGLQVRGLPLGWNAQNDGSIQALPGYRGVEIVSPILKGADGVRQIIAVCEWLKVVGAKVNRSTGFHVHVGFAGTAKQLAVLTGLVSYHETALYASTGTKSREQGTYSRPIKNSAEHKTVAQMGSAMTARYHSLNLTNLQYGNKPTVEFRLFAGTCNAMKAIGYVRMCLALVEKSLEMKVLPKWDAKAPEATSKAARRGAGKFALARFYNCFGWTKGKTKNVYGNVAAEEVAFDATKKILSEMAAKYDGRGTQE